MYCIVHQLPDKVNCIIYQLPDKVNCIIYQLPDSLNYIIYQLPDSLTKIYQNNIRFPCYFFCYMHLKVAWNSILAPKSLFTYDVTISCLKAWYTLLTTKNWFFGKGNYFICITVIFQLIATDNFHFGTPLKCQWHSKYFHLCAYFGVQLTITFFSNDRFSLNFQAMLSINRYIY